jgi:thiol:disulfide interchange protein DsbD
MWIRIAAWVMAATAAFGQQAAAPIAWSAKPQQATVKPGEKFTVTILAAIASGWHLYSTEQEAGGPLPTRIKMAPGQPFEPAGTVEESAARVEFDPVFNLEVQYFENEASFQAPLKVTAEAKPGKQRVTINATFQACNKKMCLPPKTVAVGVDVTVAAR